MVDNILNLPVIEIPGLAEARQREHDLRDLAFLPIGEEIAGIQVKQYCPTHLLALDVLKNGFVVPCTFESHKEKAAHALQFLWIVSNEYRIPSGAVDTLWMKFRRARFIKMAAAKSGYAIYNGIMRYIDDAFMDCPGSGSAASSDSCRRVSHASFMASIIDNLYAAGYPWSEAEILSTPFRRLWQYMRVSMKRMDPELSLSNPSDKLSADFIAKLNTRAT